MRISKTSLLRIKIYCFLLLFITLQSCAFLTSFKKNSIEKNSKLAFQEKICFSDNFSNTIFFFEDGSCFLIHTLSPEKVESFIKKRGNKIYGKYADYRTYWGVYQINQKFINIEFLEVVHQGGVMGICRWNAVLQNQGEILEILPGPVNRTVKTVSHSTFPYTGISLKEDRTLNEINFNPEKAWVNR